MFAARAIRRVPVSQVFARRAMSGGGHSVEQLQAETVTWKKLSFGKFNFTSREMDFIITHCEY
jgi:hypothetical protein